MYTVWVERKMKVYPMWEVATGEIMAQYRFLVLSTGAVLDASTVAILVKYWDDSIGPRFELQYYFGTGFQYYCSTDFHYYNSINKHITKIF